MERGHGERAIGLTTFIKRSENFDVNPRIEWCQIKTSHHNVVDSNVSLCRHLWYSLRENNWLWRRHCRLEIRLGLDKIIYGHLNDIIRKYYYNFGAQRGAFQFCGSLSHLNSLRTSMRNLKFESSWLNRKTRRDSYRTLKLFLPKATFA